jgi:hypothetical protein
MTTTATATEIRFYAKRDNAKQGLGDYDRAMCHADIYGGDSFEDAKAALVAYIEDEAQYAIENTYRYTRASSLRRAADLLEAAEAVAGIKGLPTNEAWTRASIVGAGIEYTLIRVERKAKAA